MSGEGAPGPPAPRRRAIRSFVLRQGRMSPAQQRACDELMPKYGVPFAPASPRLRAGLRPHRARGAGDRLRHGRDDRAIAAAHPQTDFLAVEVHLPASGALLRRIDAASSPTCASCGTTRSRSSIA
jgi:tRNA (guanine-N7-)-methyltransferase